MITHSAVSIQQSAFSLAATCLLLTAVVGAETTNRIVAMVNKDIITEWDVNVRLSALMEGQEEPFDDHEEASEFRRAVIRRLIEERLIIQEGHRMGVTVALDEVAARVQELRREFAPKERYDAMLQEAQLTEEQLKTKLREQLLMQRTIDQKVRSTIVISPAEVQRALKAAPAPHNASSPPEDDVFIAHVLVRISEERSVEEAQRLIDQLSQRLLSGEAFERLAREHSEGPHAEEGGRLGWMKPSEILPELSRALSALRPGEVSKPIRSHLGFHLVKMLDRRQPQSQDPASIQETVQRQLYQQKFANAMGKWLAGLQQQAYIQVTDEP